MSHRNGTRQRVKGSVRKSVRGTTDGENPSVLLNSQSKRRTARHFTQRFSSSREDEALSCDARHVVLTVRHAALLDTMPHNTRPKSVSHTTNFGNCGSMWSSHAHLQILLARIGQHLEKRQVGVFTPICASPDVDMKNRTPSGRWVSDVQALAELLMKPS